MTHTYAHLQRWSCDKCQASGELGRFAAGEYGVDALALANRLHKVTSPDCDGVVRVSQQGEYPD